MLDERVLARQIVILVGQVLELRIEVALLKGKLAPKAVEDAFCFLSGSALLQELFDDEHLRLLKAAYIEAYGARPSLPPLLDATLEEPAAYLLGETANDVGKDAGVVLAPLEE